MFIIAQTIQKFPFFIEPKVGQHIHERQPLNPILGHFDLFLSIRFLQENVQIVNIYAWESQVMPLVFNHPHGVKLRTKLSER
jgi:hypothetical protein